MDLWFWFIVELLVGSTICLSHCVGRLFALMGCWVFFSGFIVVAFYLRLAGCLLSVCLYMDFCLVLVNCYFGCFGSGFVVVGLWFGCLV